MKVIIDDYVCSEPEVAAMYEALTLLISVGQGQIGDLGHHLYTSYLGRKDVTTEFRSRLIRFRDSLNQAHKILHGCDDLKARFDPKKDAVPISSVRALQLVCRLVQDKEELTKAQQLVRIQAEMSVPV